MKERQEGCRTRRTSTCRSRVITACLVLALAVGVAGFCLTEEEAQKVQRTGCIEAEKIRIPGRETMVLNPAGGDGGFQAWQRCEELLRRTCKETDLQKAMRISGPV